MQQKSPQFSRFFSAPSIILTGKTTLWLLFIGFLAVNTYSRFFTTPLWLVNNETLLHPFSLESHMRAANAARSRGDWTNAKQELLIAQSLLHPTQFSPTNVLGITTSPMDVLLAWEKEPESLKRETSFWESIITQKPDYRDAYIQLAARNYQLGDTNEAKNALAQAQTLDPNSTIAQKLMTLLAHQ